MRQRTISGVVICVVTFGILFFSYIPAVLMTATAMLCGFCIYELARATGATSNQGLLFLALSFAAVLCFCPVPDYRILAGAALLVSIPYFAVLMKRQGCVQLQDTLSFLFLSLVIIIQFSALPRLRELPNGLHYVIIVISECFLTDVAAFLVGSRWGKRKLIASVSPNKTILGSVAGMAAAVAFCLCYGFVLHNVGLMQIHFPKLLGYAVVANLLAQYGDLSMSVIKRITGIKDFSNLIPGHGGMLDRFDSHIFVLSFTYLFCCLSGGFI